MANKVVQYLSSRAWWRYWTTPGPGIVMLTVIYGDRDAPGLEPAQCPPSLSLQRKIQQYSPAFV